MAQPQDHLDATLIAADFHGGLGNEDSAPSDTTERLSPQGWKYALKRVLGDILPDGLLDLAALLTFFSILSLAPALLVGYSLITLFLASDSSAILSSVRELVPQYVPEEQADVVLGVIDSVAGSATGGRVGIIVGLVVALWTSSAYVRAFSRCANAVYGRSEGRTIWKQWGMMFLLNIGLLLGAIIILVSWVLNESLVKGLLAPIAEPLRLTEEVSFLTDTFIPVWNWVRWPVIIIVLIMFVATLYHWAPNARPWKFRWLSIGSVFAIGGIIFAGGALDLYFTYFAAFNTYGAVSSVIAIVIALWIYNICLIIGLKIDVEISRARQLQAGLPAENFNLVPPRSIEAVAKLKQRQQELVDEARQLREGAN
ncbi:YihY/virulence factor BrkB family protein [Corynebacterium deserti]|uniref:YihY/virulence factor BrkB family protein n=1 Tax=Corynebacterium deserti TaxID=1408191 RepID=UPI0006AD175C|nr:YihY/virulence factor BrkB family protein [Corynebacterium deserti]